VAYLDSNYPCYYVYYYRPYPYPSSSALPYYIFPTPFSEPKTQKRRRNVCACVSPPPPCSVVCCAALCALGRGPVCEGHCGLVCQSDYPSDCLCPPPRLFPQLDPSPPCALTQVRSVPPLRLHLRHRGPSVLNGPKRRFCIASRGVSRQPQSGPGRPHRLSAALHSSA
jgi:hypothetical protein